MIQIAGEFGQLGHEDMQQKLVPTVVSTLSHSKNISFLSNLEFIIPNI